MKFNHSTRFSILYQLFKRIKKTNPYIKSFILKKYLTLYVIKRRPTEIYSRRLRL